MSASPCRPGVPGCGHCGGDASEPWEKIAALYDERSIHPGDSRGTRETPSNPRSRMLRPGGLTLTARAMEACAFPIGARVLDAGCGAGDSLAFMHGLGLTPLGIDLSPSQLARCRARADLLALRGQAQQLPLCDGCLDGILSECVLSLLPDHGQVLGEWHRVLRPGGMLALSDLYALDRCTPTRLTSRPTSCLEGALPLQSLLELVSSAGFEPLLVEDHTPLLKRFAADLVFAGIPLETFLGRSPAGACGQKNRNSCVQHGKRPRTGYCLLVARKKESRHG